MLKFGTPTIALPLAIKNVLFRLDALYINLGKRVYIKTHINKPFSARGNANFNELYTSHDSPISGEIIS